MGLTFHRTWPIPACPHADPPSHNLEISSPFAKLPEIDRVKRLTSENASSHLCSIREFFFSSHRNQLPRGCAGQIRKSLLGSFSISPTLAPSVSPEKLTDHACNSLKNDK